MPTAARLLHDLRLPDFRDYAVAVATPGGTVAESTRVMGTFLRDVMRKNADNFRVFGPDETASNRLGALFEVTNRTWMAERFADDDHLSPRWPGDGDPLRARLPGLARRLSAHRSARAVLLLRGLHPHRRFDVQPARQVAQGVRRDSLAPTDRLAQHPAHLARLAPGHNGFSHQDPGLHRPRGEQEGRHHPRLSAAGRQHAAGGHRPLPEEPQSGQCHRRRQAARAAVAGHGGGHQPRRRRHRPVGMGVQRPARRTGRRSGGGGRRADTGNAGRHRSSCASSRPS